MDTRGRIVAVVLLGLGLAVIAGTAVLVGLVLVIFGWQLRAAARELLAA